MRICYTEREKEEFALIQSFFLDMAIINPIELDSKNLLGKEIIIICYELVAVADIIVFSEYHDSIGRGVYSETKLACELGKPVYLLRWGKLYPVEKENLFVFEFFDWSVHYARVHGIKAAM